MIECTGIAVRDPEVGWLALCPEYNIAATGATASDALGRLGAMIEVAVGIAQQNRLAVGLAVAEEQVVRFLATHSSEQPRWRWTYGINTDLPSVVRLRAEPLLE